MDNFQTPRRCFETWQYKYVSIYFYSLVIFAINSLLPFLSFVPSSKNEQSINFIRWRGTREKETKGIFVDLEETLSGNRNGGL